MTTTKILTNIYVPLGTLVVPVGDVLIVGAQPCIPPVELEAWRRKGFDLSHIRVMLLAFSTTRLGICSATIGGDERDWRTNPKRESYGESYTIDATSQDYPPEAAVRFLLSAVDGPAPVSLGANVWLYAYAKPPAAFGAT